ncbi:MAG: hypothetical protein JSV00_05300 [bacterium]|nr:MAG: hypothetical protein JSV00_05300 [bacterium]
MSETAAYMALIETASVRGVQTRIRYLKEHGAHEMGWNYANILDVGPALLRQLQRKGFFRVYLCIPDENGSVRYAMKITALRTFNRPEIFRDPVDGRRYLVHSRMLIHSIEELDRPRKLTDFTSIDMRKPDIRHLQLGFLFVVDPEV